MFLPRKKYPERIVILFYFSGRAVRDTMSNMFFFLILGSIFMHLRPGHLPVFLKIKWGKGSKSRILEAISRS